MFRIQTDKNIYTFTPKNVQILKNELFKFINMYKTQTVCFLSLN